MLAMQIEIRELVSENRFSSRNGKTKFSQKQENVGIDMHAFNSLLMLLIK